MCRILVISGGLLVENPIQRQTIQSPGILKPIKASHFSAIQLKGIKFSLIILKIFQIGLLGILCSRFLSKKKQIPGIGVLKNFISKPPLRVNHNYLFLLCIFM